MRRILLPLFSLMLCLSAFTILGNGSKGATLKDVEIIIKRKSPTPIGQPRAPELLNVVCFYSDNAIATDFINPEGNADMTVWNSTTGESSYHTFDSSDQSVIYVGELGENSTIDIHTQAGNDYYGVLKYDGISL